MIYFVRDVQSGHIKIGHAADPWRRLANMQTATVWPLEIVALEDGAAKREAELHRQFAEARVRGEWFTPTLSLQAYVAGLGKPAAKPVKIKSRAFWGGMTDEELAARVSVHRATLTRLRQGKRRASPDLAIEIQRATGLSAIHLAFGEMADEAIAALVKREAA